MNKKVYISLLIFSSFFIFFFHVQNVQCFDDYGYTCLKEKSTWLSPIEMDTDCWDYHGERHSAFLAVRAKTGVIGQSPALVLTFVLEIFLNTQSTGWDECNEGGGTWGSQGGIFDVYVEYNLSIRTFEKNCTNNNCVDVLTIRQELIGSTQLDHTDYSSDYVFPNGEILWTNDISWNELNFYYKEGDKEFSRYQPYGEGNVTATFSYEDVNDNYNVKSKTLSISISDFYPSSCPKATIGSDLIFIVVFGTSGIFIIYIYHLKRESIKKIE
ncbi:MAG: hypothetical protein ACFFG0_32090 [Candidatus Thorarchaeota archaeon]